MWSEVVAWRRSFWSTKDTSNSIRAIRPPLRHTHETNHNEHVRSRQLEVCIIVGRPIPADNEHVQKKNCKSANSVAFPSLPLLLFLSLVLCLSSRSSVSSSPSLGRPTYSRLGLKLYPDSSVFFRQLYTLKLIERNSTATKTCRMFGSGCDLKMHVQNLGCPLILQIGAKTPIFDIFRRLRNLKATSTANNFRTKHDIDHWKRALETTRVL